MKKTNYLLQFFLLCFLFTVNINNAISQDISSYFPEIKISKSNNPAEGYFFLASKGLSAEGTSQYIAIVDNLGTPVFFRLMEGVSSTMRLLPDGRIVYWQGRPRILYFLNEMLEIDDTITTRNYGSNGHDWAISEQGNIVLMGKDNHVVDMSEFIENGDTAASILDIVIQEFDSDKNLLYTWYSKDHFDIFDGNENSPYLDYTENEIDYIHLNSVAIDSDTSIIISSRHMDEITKINRLTGDIIWRLGGKNNDFTFTNDDIGFSHQHSIFRLDNGNILLYDNGNLHDVRVSSSVEYELDEVNMTATLVNRFRRSPDVYTNHASNTHRIYNGNTLNGWGPYWPSATEFHPDGTAAIELDFTKHSYSNKIHKFLWETKVFETDVDTLDFGMWDGENPIQKSVTITNNYDSTILITSFSSHTDYFQVSATTPLSISSGESINITIEYNPAIDAPGTISDVMNINSDTDNQRIARQLWLFGQKEDNDSPSAIIMPDSTNVPVFPQILFAFNEPIRYLDNSKITYTNISEYIIFRYDNFAGEDVGYNAYVSADKKTIELVPNGNLDEDQTYYLSFSDQFEDFSDNPAISAEATFTTITASSLPEIEKSFALIFPNPTNGMLNINTNMSNNKTIKLTSILGELILQKEYGNDKSCTIDLCNISTGIYMLIIQNKHEKIVKRIIKL